MLGVGVDVRRNAPIALFIFNRAEHLRRTLGNLQRCRGFADSRIVVFGDGPRTSQDVEAVERTRATAQELLGSSAEYHFRTDNHGLARSIIAGVGNVVSRFGRVIVVEDDLEVSNTFLDYMNSALERYDGHAQVFQISAHMFDVPGFIHRSSVVFLPLTTTWGWATWDRAWECFDPSAQGWERLMSDANLRHRFNLEGAYDYASMLQRQMRGRGDSWGIRWYWSVFKRSGIGCFPPISLVRNTGMDGSGTHGRGFLRSFEGRESVLYEGKIELPERVEVHDEPVELVKRAIWRQNGGWIGAATDRSRRFLRALKRD